MHYPAVRADNDVDLRRACAMSLSRGVEGDLSESHRVTGKATHSFRPACCAYFNPLM
jgi:hypothetical protein